MSLARGSADTTKSGSVIKNNEPACYIADRRFRSKHQLEGLGNTHCWYGVGRAAAAVGRFVGFAKANQQQTFIVTNVGCSKKAGFYPREIAYMFETIAEHPNLYLSRNSVKKIALVT